MLKAIGAALRSVMFALLLLLGLVYVFAIATFPYYIDDASYCATWAGCPVGTDFAQHFALTFASCPGFHANA